MLRRCLRSAPGLRSAHGSRRGGGSVELAGIGRSGRRQRGPLRLPRLRRARAAAAVARALGAARSWTSRSASARRGRIWSPPTRWRPRWRTATDSTTSIAALVEQLTATAAACVPDRQWWIDDVAIDLEGDDLTADEASCVAIAYVDVLGVNEVIRRRILTIPPARRAVRRRGAPRSPTALRGLAGQCSWHSWTRRWERASPGSAAGPTSTAVIDCAAAHNSEVVAVHDLGAEYATWPGMQTLRDKTITQCPADVEALPVDAADYIAGLGHARSGLVGAGGAHVDLHARAAGVRQLDRAVRRRARRADHHGAGEHRTRGPRHRHAHGRPVPPPTGRLARPDGRGTTAVHRQVRQPAPRGGVPRLRARRRRHSVPRRRRRRRLAPTRAASTPSSPYVGVPYDRVAPLLLVLLARPVGVGLREPARAVRAAQRGSR